jgi:hypothetical protein
MATTLTPEEKKQRQKGVLTGLFAGIALATLIWNLIYTKKINKLEAKIFKLEGWQ